MNKRTLRKDYNLSNALASCVFGEALPVDAYTSGAEVAKVLREVAAAAVAAADRMEALDRNLVRIRERLRTQA